MANWDKIQTPLIPQYGYIRTVANLGNITVAPAGTSLYNTTPNHRIIVGKNEYRADINGQVTVPTADAALINARLTSGVLNTLALVSTTA